MREWAFTNIKEKILGASVVAALVVCIALSKPAYASTCTAGNLSAVIGTPCNIGSITFDFTSLQGQSPSDFNFTPVANGFTLSFLGGPQSITGPSNGGLYEQAYLNFDVISGGITQAYVSGDTSPFSVSGSNISQAFNAIGLVQGSPSVWLGDHNQLYDQNGTIYTDTQAISSSGPPLTVGGGSVYVFLLYAENGNTASWDGSDLTVTFDTVATTVPEPSSLLLLGTGIAGLAGVIRRKRK